MREFDNSFFEQLYDYWLLLLVENLVPVLRGIGSTSLSVGQTMLFTGMVEAKSVRNCALWRMRATKSERKTVLNSILWPVCIVLFTCTWWIWMQQGFDLSEAVIKKVVDSIAISRTASEIGQTVYNIQI